MPLSRHQTTSVPATANDTSTELDLDALLNGDHAAFEVLVRQESPRLYRMIVRMVRSEDEAQSVLQETFLQAYKRLHTFRRESKVTTWIYAIGLNLARASLRKARRYNPMEEEDLERLQPTFTQRGMYADPVDSWNPQKVTERTERRRLVHAAIQKLPDSYRDIVMLRDIEGLSSAEVAQIVDISEGAVRVRLHRARQALRSLLAAHFK